MRSGWATAAVLAALAAASASRASASCATDPRVVGTCFAFHGRASLWNGNPTLRIWRIGTTRVLGVRDGAPVPDEVKEKLGSGWNQVFGDFRVCPFTPSRPGRMQIVCVESARHLVAMRRE